MKLRAGRVAERLDPAKPSWPLALKPPGLFSAPCRTSTLVTEKLAIRIRARLHRRAVTSDCRQSQRSRTV